jgi:hypothetical protein
MDQPKSDKPQLVRIADRPADESYSHPLNPKSEMRGISLSRLAGLEPSDEDLVYLVGEGRLKTVLGDSWTGGRRGHLCRIASVDRAAARPQIADIP